jgi:hypothetical protein
MSLGRGENDMTTASGYLKYLPSIFQFENSFTDNFLKGFEELLSFSYLQHPDLLDLQLVEHTLWGRKFNLDSLENHIVSEWQGLLSRAMEKAFLIPLKQGQVRDHQLREVPRPVLKNITVDTTNLTPLLTHYYIYDLTGDTLRNVLNIYFDPQTGAIIDGADYDSLMVSLQKNKKCLENPPIPMEEAIKNIPCYFDAYRTPAQFLHWLAGWFGLYLKNGEDYNNQNDLLEKSRFYGQVVPLTEDEKNNRELNNETGYNRKLLANIFNLYLKRATRAGLEDYLNFYINNLSYLVSTSPHSIRIRIPLKGIMTFEIHEYLYPFIIQDCNTDMVDGFYRGLRVGESTVVHHRDPFNFRIIIRIKNSNFELIEKIKADVMELVDREKPAHTRYFISFIVDSMQTDSMVGYDTTIGGEFQAAI